MTKIIIKTLNNHLANHLIDSLKDYSHIRFFAKRINGEYRIVIFCDRSNINSHSHVPVCLRQNYIYYYTTISLLLCDIIIDFFEEKIISYYFKKSIPRPLVPSLQNAKNISSLILDPNYPSTHSKELYLYKKNIILNALLSHFKNHNNIIIESFALFSLPDYHEFLKKVSLTSLQIILENNFEEDFVNYILNNFFK